jgi:uncharacterized membrane protein YeaQ/YmgE (transglycosylase-associated protein family)
LAVLVGGNPRAQRRQTWEALMLGFIIGLIIVGLIAGFIARLILPGPDPMSVGMTIALGIVGSFVGGFLAWLLFGRDLGEGPIQPSGILGSIIGAVIVLAAYRWSARRHSRVHTMY